MKKRETKNKKQIREETQNRDEKDAETKTDGFPKNVDFKKFLGCGG
ncbi:MAG: hypothetical protein ABJG78_16005 [Cyclobacteriaceae bacterium]